MLFQQAFTVNVAHYANFDIRYYIYYIAILLAAWRAHYTQLLQQHRVHPSMIKSLLINQLESDRNKNYAIKP